ncbi:MAG: hypothetical protein QHH09_00630 [Microgenomates group bacterium]|nr:hypothetical protein [Microgenomates group bacterium]
MKKNYQVGQTLLIVILLLASAITIVLSISFTTTLETQTTKLEEESQRALAAAEAGIEAALKQGGRIEIADLAGLGNEGFTGSAEFSEDYHKNYFVTPLLQKDEQYTFYLDKYTAGNSPPFENSSYNGNLTIYYGSPTGCNEMAIEITIVYYDGGYKIKRYIADTGNKLGSTTDNIGNTNGKTLDDEIFNCRTSSLTFSSTSFPNSKILIIRSLFDESKIGFEGTNTLKPQGKFIVSQATTPGGVTKTVELFQSYPQIPSEFFVTRF